MVDIEIPLKDEKPKVYRLLECLPATLSWSILLMPVILSQISPIATAAFILGYLLMWFVRAVGLNVRVLQGWRTLKAHQNLHWDKLLKDVENREVTVKNPKWHTKTMKLIDRYSLTTKPSDVIHVIMIATYNESREVLEPTIKAVLKSKYDMKKVILVLAFEERGGPEVEKQAYQLMKDYGSNFMFAKAVKHPKDLPNEVVGKGGNITFAGRDLQKELEKRNIDPNLVVLTTLDSDNRPHPSYLPALTYTFCLSPNPKLVSYQPIPMFTNNIWDAPAPMRVIATGNSFWMIVQALRPHMLRNFSAHAQSMAALIETDFWSVRTIVEDGHQFWRTYLRYDGKHEVYPIYIPIYQDAVLADGYKRTLKAQFVQIRRWAWGASDIPFLIYKGYLTKNKIPKLDLTFKFFRLLEGHVSWATAPVILLFSAFIPVLFNPQDIAANQLPNIASSIQRVAMVGIGVTLFLSLRALPPKPERYKRHRTFFMVIQWVYLPLTGLIYNCFSALYSQTRLFFGRYLDKFDVTEKAVKS